MNCPKCQAEIAAGVKFCPECGSRLGTAIGLEGEVSLGGLKTMAGAVSLGQMPTQLGATKSAGASLKTGERYETLAEIGRGGFAVVYRAKDLKLGREVAVKRLLASVITGALGQQVLERFGREGQTIAALNHRNIVMVYDHDQDADGAYVVMEYVNGGSLRELQKSQGGKLEVAEAVELIKGVARGLAYAHRKNLIHRDIKPANILLVNECGERIPKIVDFGLARMGSESELSLSGMGMGTPWYMPPEQRRNAKGVNHTADLYALGKTLYELVTGEVPDSVEAEKLPAWLRPIIQKCIRNNPEERYFSAEELLNDLEKMGSGPAATGASPSTHAHQCPTCEQINSEAEKFCLRCGTGLNRTCLECGREQRAKIRFCGGCGTDLPVYEKAAAILDTIRRYAGEQKSALVYTGVESFRQVNFNPKGSKGKELLNEVERLDRETKEVEAGLQRVEETKRLELQTVEAARAAAVIEARDREAACATAVVEKQKFEAERSRVAIEKQERLAREQHTLFTNSLGMKFVLVPGTAVRFCIWNTRVQDFETFVNATGHNATGGMYSLRNGSCEQTGATWKNPQFSQGPTHPVVGVNWEDAQAFCAWLTQVEQRAGKIGENQSYRLPTDWEWSVAVGLDEASIGTPAQKGDWGSSVYPWGTQWPPPPGAGNYAVITSNNIFSSKVLYDDGFEYTAPVGSFSANKYGLYDLGGNVWEWCDDYAYFAENEDRVLRGASWANKRSWELMSAHRSSCAPGDRADNGGFRVVLADAGSSSEINLAH